MPTSTVRASSTLAMAAVLLIMRPMNESTMSRAEMSISTPLARSLTMRAVRSSCSVIASRSCISTWMVTSSRLPILNMKMRSIRSSLISIRMRNRRARALQGNDESIRQSRLGDDILKVDSQIHEGLRNLRTNAADDAVRAHQARGSNGFQQMLRHQRIDRRHAGDIDDRNHCSGFDYFLQQTFHHHLRACAIERADQRQRQDVLPQLHHRRRKFQQFILLAQDDLLAAFLINLDREQSKPVEQRAGRRGFFDQSLQIVGKSSAQIRKQRLFQRKNEIRGFDRRKSLAHARLRNIAKQLAHNFPRRSI